MPPRGGGSDGLWCGNGSVPRWATSLSFQLESSTHRTLRVEAAHTGPAPRLNPPDGGAFPLGGSIFFVLHFDEGRDPPEATGISLGGGGVKDTRGD